MPDFSRREILRAAAIGSAFSLLPASIRKALAIPANNRTGTINDVEHVVILMQENRSFDHYFGTLPGVRGFSDRITIPLPDNRHVWQQQGEDRLVLPYHLDSKRGNAQRVSGTPHSWVDEQAAWDSGRMSAWPTYKTPTSMGYYRRHELPFQFALAETFTLCDAYHCSIHAGTNTNRLFHWTGTNGPTAAEVAVVVNEWDSPGPPGVGYQWQTYPERLEASGVSWKVYQFLPDNFTDNPLAGFRQYRAASVKVGNPAQPPKDFTAFVPYRDELNAEAPLYKGNGNTLPAADGNDLEAMLAGFRADVQQGKLPQVSWIIAPAAYSEHPGPSSPVQGGWFTQEILNALTENPEVWSKTVLLVNYDENDGFFDHMPSPSAPSLREDGTFAGKSTVPFDSEIFQHVAPPGSQEQPPPDGASMAPARVCPCWCCRPGAAVAGLIHRCSTTLQCCNFSRSASRYTNPISAPGDARYVAISLRPSTLSIPTGKPCPICPPPAAIPPIACASGRSNCRRCLCQQQTSNSCRIRHGWHALHAPCLTNCMLKKLSPPASNY